MAPQLDRRLVDPAAEPARRPPSAGASAGAVVGFAAAFVLACLGARAALSLVPGLHLEEVWGEGIKARHFREHEDEYDVVFVGSSRTYRQLNPAVFDHRMLRGGLEVRSYNYGLPGMRFYETIHTVDWILDRRPWRLRWLIVELTDPDPPLRLENRLTRRDINWHTPELTWLACRTVLASDRPPLAKLREVREHLLQAACRFSNAGTGVPALAVLFGGASVPPDPTPAGFLSLERDPNPSVGARRDVFAAALRENPDALVERTEALRAEPDDAEPAPLLVEVLGALAARIRAAGVEPLFVLLPPVEHRLPEVLGAHARGALPELLSYEDPDDHPDFYLKRAIRYDWNHLTGRGVSRLTNMLARDVLRRAEREGE